MHRKAVFKPLEHALEVDAPSLHQNLGYAAWPAQNFNVRQRSLQKRNGYLQVRDLGEEVQAIIYFTSTTGANATVFLTPTNACEYESAGTFSYITKKYSTGTVASITNDAVEGTGTPDWDSTDGPAQGDFFVMNDDLTAASEIDQYWQEIETVTDDDSIILYDYYRGATSSGNYTIRQVYTTPTNERWSWCIFDDKLVIANGDCYTQYWTGSDNFVNCNTTSATKARYCTEYADRLFLADMYVSASRAPCTVMWSKNGDLTDWTDSTAGSVDLEDTEDIITGLSKVGGDLIVYKTDSIVIGNRTGVATAPVIFPHYQKGIGCPAPYGLVHAMGTDFFIGRDDFYVMVGTQPYPIGEKIRYKFFDIVNPTELKRAFGYVNTLQSEVRWFVNDEDSNRRCFVYDYKRKEWGLYIYHNDMACGGCGEV